MAPNETESARHKSTRQRGLFQIVRSNFLTGLVLIAPIVITLYLTWAIITFIDGKVVPLVPAIYNPSTYINYDIPGFGVVIFLVFTTLVGYFTKNLFGRQLVRWGESWVDSVPVVRSIYNALKQLVETIFTQSQSSFKQACMIEYPRKGLWAVAFVSTETRGEITEKADDGEMLSVFLPTTPNPTSGFLLFVPRTQVIMLDMTVEDAAKMVISAGLVVPPSQAERAAEERQLLARKAALAQAAAPKSD